MKYKLVKRVASIVFLIFMLCMSTVLVVQLVEFDKSTIKIDLNSSESANIDVSLDNLLPGDERKVEYLVSCSAFNKFEIKFFISEVNNLAKSIEVNIQSNDKLLYKGKIIDLLGDSILVDIQKKTNLKIVYSIPLSVGNEISGESIEMKIDFTVRK